MALDNILQYLETMADDQIAEIEQAAQAEIERIRVQAQAEAEDKRQAQLANIQGPLGAEQARILNRARSKALQTVLETRENLLRSALEAAAKELAALPGMTENYKPILKRLTQNAVEALGADGPVHLQVMNRDLALMQKIVKELKLTTNTLENSLESEDLAWGGLGGLIASRSEGQISLDNTLDTRLQRASTLYRSQIAALLFDAQQQDG